MPSVLMFFACAIGLPSIDLYRLMIKLMRCEPMKGRMDREQAKRLVLLVQDPGEVLAAVLEIKRVRPLPFEIRQSKNGDIPAACIRLMWRYLAFQPYRPRAKYDLREFKKPTPEWHVYTLTKKLMAQPLDAAQVPGELREGGNP